MKEKAANDAAIAIAKAEEFDLPSSMSATRAMVQQSGSSSILNSEQCQLYEQIMKEKAAASHAMMVQQSGSTLLSQSSQEGDGILIVTTISQSAAGAVLTNTVQ